MLVRQLSHVYLSVCPTIFAFGTSETWRESGKQFPLIVDTHTVHTSPHGLTHYFLISHHHCSRIRPHSIFGPTTHSLRQQESGHDIFKLRSTKITCMSKISLPLGYPSIRIIFSSVRNDSDKSRKTRGARGLEDPLD